MNKIVIILLIVINIDNAKYIFSQNDNLKEIFFREAPQSWQQYFDFCMRLEGTIHFQQVLNNKSINERTIIINNNFPTYSFESIGNDATSETTIKGYNNLYNFELLKSKNQKKEYVVKNVNKHTNEIDLKNFTYSMPFQTELQMQEYGMDFLRTVLLGGVELTPIETLPLIVSLPEFEIISIERRNVNRNNCIEIIYEFEPSQEKYPIVVGSGKILLDSETWLIMSCEFNRLGTDNKISYHIENEYRTGTSKYPIIVKRIKKSLSEGTLRSQETTIYELHESQGHNKKLFTLSHYGLPEPDFGESRPNRIRYIMMTLGGILILLAGWQMYQKRRDKQEETSL